MKRSSPTPKRLTVVLLAAALMIGGCAEKRVPVPTAPPAPSSSPAPTAYLTATPTVISAGDQVTLSWRTTNATSVLIDGIGEVPTAGVKTVSPGVSTNYHLVARSDGGTAEATAYVSVNAPPSPEPAPVANEIPANCRTIFFSANSSTLSSASQSTLSCLAQYLASHTDVKISVGGHSDDTGSTEHNLALAEDRANQARVFLAAQGISADRIRIISYGRESPFCLETSEACKEQNRRAQISIDDSSQSAVPLTPTRDFLRSGTTEGDGYGLYSYILFAAPPTDAQRDAYRALIHSYLSEIRPKNEYQSQQDGQGAEAVAHGPVPASEKPILNGQLNIIFLPVTSEIDKCTLSKDDSDGQKNLQDCIINHAYDYRRAHNLLAEIDGLQPKSAPKHTRGPYIISTLVPIDKIGNSAHLVYVNQDLTGIPQNVVEDHVNEFLDETSQPMSITTRTIRRFMLGLRTSVAQTAGPMDNVITTITLIWGQK